MSSIQTMDGHASHRPDTAPVDQKLEVVIIPVSDVDRAKKFYEELGWRLDADFAKGDDWRLVQMTPPGSPCSVMFGRGVTSAVPGSLQGAFLVVDDLETARNELGRRRCRGQRSLPFPSRSPERPRSWICARARPKGPLVFLVRLVQ